MKEYLTKNWRNILIVLLAVFSLSKCTQSCNRDGEIKKLTERIEKSDSISSSEITKLTTERDSLRHSLNLANERANTLDKMNSTLTDVAKKETKVQIVKSR